MEKYLGQSSIEIEEARERPQLKKMPLIFMEDGKKVGFVAEYYIEPISIGIDKCAECKDSFELFIEKIAGEPNIILDGNREDMVSANIVLKIKNALRELINIEELEMLKNPKMCVCDKCRDKNNNFIEDRKDTYVKAMLLAASKTKFIIDEDNLREAIFRK